MRIMTTFIAADTPVVPHNNNSTAACKSAFLTYVLFYELFRHFINFICTVLRKKTPDYDESVIITVIIY